MKIRIGRLILAIGGSVYAQRFKAVSYLHWGPVVLLADERYYYWGRGMHLAMGPLLIQVAVIDYRSSQWPS